MMVQPSILQCLFVLLVQVLYSECGLTANNTTSSSIPTASPASPTPSPSNISTASTLDIPTTHISSRNSSTSSSQQSSSPQSCEWYQKRVWFNNTYNCTDRKQCHAGFEFHPNDLSKIRDTEDWNCQSCSKNQFQSKEGHFRCTTCKVTSCGHQRFLVRNCTAKSDGYCSVCPIGYFQHDKTGGCHRCKPCCNIHGQHMKKETDCLNHTPGLLKNKLCLGNDTYCISMYTLEKAKYHPATTAKPHMNMVDIDPKHWQVIFGVTVGVIILFGVVIFISIFCYRWRKKYSKFFNTGGSGNDLHIPNHNNSKGSEHTQVNITQMGDVQYRKLVQQSCLVENNSYTGPPENMLEVDIAEDGRDELKLKLEECNKLQDFSEDGFLLH